MLWLNCVSSSTLITRDGLPSLVHIYWGMLKVPWHLDKGPAREPLTSHSQEMMCNLQAWRRWDWTAWWYLWTCWYRRADHGGNSVSAATIQTADQDTTRLAANDEPPKQSKDLWWHYLPTLCTVETHTHPGCLRGVEKHLHHCQRIQNWRPENQVFCSTWSLTEWARETPITWTSPLLLKEEETILPLQPDFDDSADL